MSSKSKKSIERLLEENATDDEFQTRSATRDCTRIERGKIVVAILIIINLLWSGTLFARPIISRHNRFNYELRKLSTPSPLFDVVDLSLGTQMMNGDFNISNSIYRQNPSIAVDEAWSKLALEDHQLITVKAADIRAAGKNPVNSVRWDESVDAYPAQVEFSHKIHCLNEIRKEIWGEHYFGVISIHSAESSHIDGGEDIDNGPVTNRPTRTGLKAARQLHREHAMHCLHMVLQDLMCNLDVGIITHEWITDSMKPGSPAYPKPDYNTRKQCRDFDAAAAWIRRNAMPDGLEKFSYLAKQQDPDISRVS